MAIEGVNSALTNLRNLPKVSSSGSGSSSAPTKSLGETPPIPLTLQQIGSLAALFARGGMVDKIKRRLNRLKNKKCKVIPAKGTIACIDSDDVVYLGVDFLEQFRDQEEVIAGVLSHEWGHSCAIRPTPEEIQKLNWNEIFEMRKAHETLADEICGRLMALMGYKIDGIVNFLGRGKKTHNLKYHPVEVRQDIIRHGYEDEKKNIKFANSLFPKKAYANQYHSIVLDEI